MDEHASRGLTIRPYRIDDRESVIALWRECGLTVPANDPGRDIDRKVRSQPDLFLVAEFHGEVVGTAMAGYEGHRGWIYYLGVRPDHRRRGIGRQLVDAAVRLLRPLGCPKVNLMVRRSNEAVIRFYERLGFVTDDVSCMGLRLVDDTARPAAAPPEPPGQVHIRPYKASDARAQFEAARESCAEVFRWLPWCHPDLTIGECRAWLRHTRDAWNAGTEFNFAIVDDAGRLLGGCGLNAIDAHHRTSNLGYWVRTSAARRGAATCAVRALVEYAFTKTDLERLEIVAAVGNLASRRVAEKSGAIPEGISHSRLTVHGEPHDAAVYAFVRAIHKPAPAP